MDYKELWNAGDKYYSEGNYNEAIKYLKLAYEISQTVECLNYIGCCYMKLEELNKAKDIFEKLTSEEVWERPWFNLGRIYLYEQKFSNALKCFNKAVEIAPNNGNCYFYLGVYYDKVKDKGNAVKCYQKAVKCSEHSDDKSVACLNLGLCYQSMGLYELALKEYSLAYRYDNTCLEALYNKALIFMLSKEFGKALKLFMYVYNHGMNDEEVKNYIDCCSSKI